MKVVYMGTSDFAVPALEAMRDHICLVVSQPDKPSGRGLDLKASPVKKRAMELGLPVETPMKSRSEEFVAHIRSLDADVLLVAAYGQILSKSLLESARCGGINLHGSILPKYRGAAPIQRAIQNGDLETGVTLMQMDVGLDTGDMIAIERVPIGPDDTASDVFASLASLAAEMAVQWIPRICAGEFVATPQDDSLATHAAKVDKAEAEVRFSGDAKREYDRYRAFTPFPGAFVRTSQGSLKLTGVRFDGADSLGEGVVGQIKPDFVVGFRSGSLRLLEVQPEGKKRMRGTDWANGARIKVGDRLTT